MTTAILLLTFGATVAQAGLLAPDTPGTEPPPVHLTDVRVEGAEQGDMISLLITGEVQASLRHDQDRRRLVVDLPNTRSQLVRPMLPPGLSLVLEMGIRQTRLGRGRATRLVVALKAPAEAELVSAPGLLQILLRPPASRGEVLSLYLVPPVAPQEPRSAAGTSAESATAPASAVQAPGPSGDSSSRPSRSPAPADAELGPLDLLLVKVLGVEELERRARIGADGTLALPLIGAVPAAGSTVDALEHEIARRLADGFVKDPQVSVLVEEFRSRRVSVSGAVRAPGTFEILRPTTLLEALTLAGGVLPDEAAPRVQIVRPARPEPIEIDRLALQAGQLERNLSIEPGDLVHVPFDEILEVLVQGRVARPDHYRVRRSQNLTVLRAVMLAGGLAEGASGRRVEVLRRTAGDRTLSQIVNLNRIREGKEPDLPLLPDDIVVVR